MRKVAFGSSELDSLIRNITPNLYDNVGRGRLLYIGEIIDILLTYIFPAAGILLLLYLIWGGFEIMLSGGNPKNIEEGKAKITNALIGFIIIFVSYWIVQILTIALGLRGSLEPIF